MPKQMIKLNRDNLAPFIKNSDYEEMAPDISRAHEFILKRDGKGSEYLGWLDLPRKERGASAREIIDCAEEVRNSGSAFIIIGIGGSYLGARAAIEFCNSCVSGSRLPVFYAGCSVDPDYLKFIVDEIDGRDVYVNVISKSGTTLEPALAFRVIYERLKKKYAPQELKKRIICTTDGKKGALRKFADSLGLRSFTVPDDLGGRFSVLSPVGLLPAAVAGLDIQDMLDGAQDMDLQSRECRLENNIAYTYAASRQILYRKGKKIELLSAFNPYFEYLQEWWKQLFGESEGKEHKGLFPASCVFTADLHSMGQMIQDGERNIFETFLIVDKPDNDLVVPGFEGNADGLDSINGKEINYVNHQALAGTARAHTEGGVPNMVINVPDRSPYSLGALFYFFQKAVALSGYIQGVNPFNQPGVEAYKKNMFALLGVKK